MGTPSHCKSVVVLKNGTLARPDSVPTLARGNQKIQTGEVTIADFRLYVEQGLLSSAEEEELGTWWASPHPGEEVSEDSPVRWVSHKIARGYVAWLRQQTGLDLHLPSVTQWIAAVIEFGEATPVLTGTEQPWLELRQKPDHLLGNLREWSNDKCTTLDSKPGFRTIGENYMTGSDFEDRGNAYCLPGESGPGIGFRLIQYPN